MAQEVNKETGEISGVFARKGYGADDPMQCFFNLPLGEKQYPCKLTLDPESGECVLYRLKKDGEEYAKPLGTGKVNNNSSARARAIAEAEAEGKKAEETALPPHVVGLIRTEKGNWMRIAGWLHSAGKTQAMEDPYFALRLNPYQKREGKVLFGLA